MLLSQDQVGSQLLAGLLAPVGASRVVQLVVLGVVAAARHDGGARGQLVCASVHVGVVMLVEPGDRIDY